MGMIKHSLSPENNKFGMCLQYLKKEGRDEVDFLHADLNATSLHYLKKEVRDRFLFAWK